MVLSTHSGVCSTVVTGVGCSPRSRHPVGLQSPCSSWAQGGGHEAVAMRRALCHAGKASHEAGLWGGSGPTAGFERWMGLSGEQWGMGGGAGRQGECQGEEARRTSEAQARAREDSLGLGLLEPCSLGRRCWKLPLLLSAPVLVASQSARPGVRVASH